jgi:hypothetical protein
MLPGTARDELEWPVDRPPEIPSYELSGVVAASQTTSTNVFLGNDVTP